MLGSYRHRKHAFWSRLNENRSARFAVVVYFFLARERADLSYFKPVLSDSKTHVYGVNYALLLIAAATDHFERT